MTTTPLETPADLEALKQSIESRSKILTALSDCIGECKDCLDGGPFSEDLTDVLKILLTSHQSHVLARKDGGIILLKMINSFGIIANHLSSLDATVADLQSSISSHPESDDPT